MVINGYNIHNHNNFVVVSDSANNSFNTNSFGKRKFSEFANSATDYLIDAGTNYAYRKFNEYMRTRSGRNYNNRLPSRPQRLRIQNRPSARRISRPPQTSGVGVTQNYDRKLVYRKKRMPRRRKRRWVKFCRKIKAVADRDLGTRTVVMNKLLQLSGTTPGQHLIGTVSLYGQQSTNTVHNDLFRISEYENTANPTTADGITVDRTTKVMFKSGVMDLTIKNQSYIPNGAVAVAAEAELDIYELTVGKVPPGESDFNDPVDFFNQSLISDVKKIKAPVSGSDIVIEKRGVTPFDCPTALSRYKIKIWKKTKYLLSPGQSMTYQIRDPKNRYVTRASLSDMNSCIRPGWTKILLFIAKVVGVDHRPGAEGDAGVGCFLQLGITRKYTYKIEGANEDRDVYETL